MFTHYRHKHIIVETRRLGGGQANDQACTLVGPEFLHLGSKDEVIGCLCASGNNNVMIKNNNSIKNIRTENI